MTIVHIAGVPMPSGEQRCVRCCETLTLESGILGWPAGSTIRQDFRTGFLIRQMVAFAPGVTPCEPVDLCRRETEGE